MMKCPLYGKESTRVELKVLHLDERLVMNKFAYTKLIAFFFLGHLTCNFDPTLQGGILNCIIYLFI